MLTRDCERKKEVVNVYEKLLNYMYKGKRSVSILLHGGLTMMDGDNILCMCV